MRSRDYEIPVSTPAGPGRAVVTWRILGQNEHQLQCVLESRQLSSTQVDLWEALLTLRLQLENLGIELLCQGSLVDVWPSGMCRQGGPTAYKHVIGCRDLELVRVLDPCEEGRCSSVADQQSFHRRWCDSLT